MARLLVNECWGFGDLPYPGIGTFATVQDKDLIYESVREADGLFALPLKAIEEQEFLPVGGVLVPDCFWISLTLFGGEARLLAYGGARSVKLLSRRGVRTRKLERDISVVGLRGEYSDLVRKHGRSWRRSMLSALKRRPQPIAHHGLEYVLR